jgi:hypothetical protein
MAYVKTGHSQTSLERFIFSICHRVLKKEENYGIVGFILLWLNSIQMLSYVFNIDNGYTSITVKNYYQHILMFSRPTLFLIKYSIDYIDLIVIVVLCTLSVVVILLPILDHFTSDNHIINHGIVHAIAILSIFSNFCLVLVLDLLARLMLYGSFGIKLNSPGNNTTYDDIQITAFTFYSIWCLIGISTLFLELNMGEGNLNLSRSCITQYRPLTLIIKLIIPIFGNLVI